MMLMAYANTTPSIVTRDGASTVHFDGELLTLLSRSERLHGNDGTCPRGNIGLWWGVLFELGRIKGLGSSGNTKLPNI